MKTKFRCSKCKNIFYRDARHREIKGREYILSMCDKLGVTARCYKVAQPNK